MRPVRKNNRKVSLCFLSFVALFAMTLCGCAGIEAVNPDEVIRHPLGTESVKIGMSRQQVEELWGKPDYVTTAEDKDKWKGSREVWVYSAKYTAIPVDAGYLSKSKKLYFDGDNLTNISD